MNAAKLLGSLLNQNSLGSNLLGQLLKGGQGGGIGQLLGGLLSNQRAGSGGLGNMLGGLLGGKGAASEAQATAVAEAPAVSDADAQLLIRAMCNAAKSDGHIDEAEREAIISRLGEVDESDVAFLRKELSQPLDVEGFASEVPAELAPQAYAVSVMAIKVDEQSEAQYLGQLAQGLQLDPGTCNAIHEQLGAPQIFRAA